MTELLIENRLRTAMFAVVALIILAAAGVWQAQRLGQPLTGLPSVGNQDVVSYYRPDSDQAARVFTVDGARGRDDGDGSELRPWKNLQTSIGKLLPGDALYVRGGDYRSEGTIRIADKRADRARPIRIIGDVEAWPTILGVSIANSSWVIVAGFNVIGPHELPNSWKNMPEVIVDNPEMLIDFDEPWATRKHRILEKFRTFSRLISWTKNWTSGFDINASSYIGVESNIISMHTSGVNIRNGSDHVRVEGNSITYAYSGTWNDADDAGSASTNALIRNNTIRQTFEAGITLTGNAAGTIVEGNSVEYSGGNLIATWRAGENNIIRDNTVRYGGYYTEPTEFPGRSGISIHSSGKGSRVIGNDIAYMYDPIARDGNGIIVDINPNGAFIANNVIYRSQGSGITVTKSGNVVAVHNTIIEPGHNQHSRTNGVGFRISHPRSIRNVFANNIVYKPSIGGMLFDENLEDQTYIGHNLFFLGGKPLAADGRRNIFQTSADFERTGFGENQLMADPMFSSDGDYHLQPGSPAIAAGTPRFTIVEDRDGKSRDPEHPTPGAYE